MHQVIIEQETREVYHTTLPLAILTPVGDDLTIQTDRLIDHMLSSLRSDVTALREQLAIAVDERNSLQTRIGALASAKVVDDASLVGYRKVIAQLRAEGADAGQLAEKDATIADLGGQVFTLREELSVLREELAKVNLVAERVGNASAQAVEAMAKLQHSEVRAGELANEVGALTRKLGEVSQSLDEAQAARKASDKTRERVEQSLALAERSKANALASQAAGFEAQIASVAAGRLDVDEKELEELRAKAAAGELAQSNVANLERIVAVYKERICSLEEDHRKVGETVLRQDAMVRKQALVISNQAERLASAASETLITRYMIAFKMGTTLFHSDSGAVRLLALNPESLPGLMDHGDVSRNHPVCWWMGTNGMGCLLALSVNLDSEGKPQLIMPAVAGEGGKAIAVPDMMPPKADHGAIADAISKVDSKALIAELDAATATAEELAALHSPEVARIVAVKMQRHRADLMRQELVTKARDRKAKKKLRR